MPSAPKQFAFTPILGWSTTRYDLFRICKRRYFYEYYRKYDREVPVKDIEEKRELTTVPLETGAVVHQVIAALLSRLRKTVEEIDRKKFFDFARRAVLHSTQSKEFEEVYYGLVPQVALEDIYPRVSASLENLLDSPRLQWLTGTAAPFSDEWLIDPPGYGETRIGDLKAYCKVDFLFPVEGVHHILEWKTGKKDPEKHRKQLLGYAAWASFHLEVEPEDVSPVIVYLQPVYEEVQETFNTYDVSQFEGQVRAETHEMYSYCESVPENLPLDKSAFPLVNDDRICTFCNYRGLCFPERFPKATGQ